MNLSGDEQPVVSGRRRPRASAQQPAPDVLGFPVLLVVWTAVVWGVRIRNIVGDAELSGVGRAWRLSLATGLVLGALIVGVALWSNVPQIRWLLTSDGRFLRLEVPQQVRQAVGLLAVIGSLVWLVRSVQILFADHPVGFKLVHSALAIGTVALSVAAVSALRPRFKPVERAEGAEP